jgi:hypothetical protein
MKQHFQWTPIVVALLFLPVLYVCSYLVLLKPSEPFVEPEKGNYVLRRDEYRIGGETARFLFRPMVEIDWRIRPKYWADTSEKGKRWE